MSTAEELAGQIIARLTTEDLTAQWLAAFPLACGRPVLCSPAFGGSRPTSGSLPGSAALPATTEAVPVNQTRQTGDVARGKSRGAEPGEGTGAPSRVEDQRPSGLSSVIHVGAWRRLPVAHPRVGARRPRVRPATPTAGPAAAEPARPQSVRRASRGTSDSRDQLPSIVRLAMLMFAVGVCMLVMAMVLESRATVLTTLSTRVRSRGLSARRTARHRRRGATGGRDGIRYRD